MFQKLAMASCFGAIVAACSGGAGPGISSGPSTDHAASGPESSSGGPEGAGGVGDPAACIPCRAFYQCVGTIQGRGVSGGQSLSSNSSSCPASQDKPGIFIACGGSIVSGSDTGGVLPPNSVVGTWHDVGGGVLVACFGILGPDNCITCTPSTEPQVDPTGGNHGNKKDGG